jgi:hypothetical protein
VTKFLPPHTHQKIKIFFLEKLIIFFVFKKGIYDKIFPFNLLRLPRCGNSPPIKQKKNTLC